MPSPRPIYLRLEDGSGDLLLEDGSKLLLEESADQLSWCNLQGDGDWGRRDNYAFYGTSGTISAVPVTARYWRLAADVGTAATVDVNEIYIDNAGGYQRVISMLSNVDPLPQVAQTSDASAAAWQAFDGDTGTGAAVPVGGWIQIDLGASFAVNRVGVRWGTEYATQWRMLVSDDGVNFRQAAAYNDLTPVGGTRVNQPVVDPHRLRTSFRYWRLTASSTTGAAFQVSRLAIIADGVAVSPENMTGNALPLPYVASASTEATDAYLAFDGAAGTSWTSTGTAAGEYLQIDLGATTFADTVIVESAVDGPVWTLSGSVDGVTFYDVATVPASVAGDITEKAWGGWCNSSPDNYATVLGSMGTQWLYLPFGNYLAVDVTGNGYDVTSVGAVAIADAAATLTGGSTVITQDATAYLQLVTNGSLSNAFTTRTFTCWFRQEAGAYAGRRVIYKEGGLTGGFNIYLDDDTLYTGWWSGADAAYVSASDTLIAGRWYNVSVTFDNGWVYLYLNGLYRAAAYMGATSIPLHTNGGAPPSLFASIADTNFHDGPALGNGSYTGSGFRIGEVSQFVEALTSSDMLQLYLTGRVVNALSRQDDVAVGTTDQGGGDAAVVQTQPAALSAFHDEQAVAVAITVANELTVAETTVGLTNVFGEQTAVSGRVVVGSGAVLNLEGSGAAPWLDGSIVLMGALNTANVAGTVIGGTGLIEVVGEAARISDNGLTAPAAQVVIEVPITEAGVLGTQVTFGPSTGDAAREYLIDGTAGAQLIVSNVVVEQGASVHLGSVADADLVVGNAYVHTGQLAWEGVPGAQGGLAVTVYAGGTLRLGGSVAGNPIFDVDVMFSGGSVLFEEFSGAPVTTIADTAVWTQTSVATVEVASAVADRQAVQFDGRWTGGLDVNFIMSGDGGFSWTNPVDDPEWAGCSITGTLVAYAATEQLVGFAYNDTEELAGAKAREWGTGTVTLTNAGFWAGHYQSLTANALEVTNPFSVITYGELNTRSSVMAAAEDPEVVFSGAIGLAGTLFFNAGEYGTAAQHAIEGNILINQGLVGTRLIAFTGLNAQSLLLNTATNGAGAQTNPLHIVTRGNAVTAPLRIAGVIDTYVVHLLAAEASLGHIVLENDFTGSVFNDGAHVELAADIQLGDQFEQVTVAGGVLDLQGHILDVGTVFFISEGTVADLAGATILAATWETQGVDMIGTSEWYVQTTTTAPIFRGPATLTWSDATGSPSEGTIVLPDGVDGGNNTFWLAGIVTSSPHVWSPEGTTAYDLRWVRAFHTEGDLVKLSFWGDSTIRVAQNRVLFLAAWARSRANNPRLTWLPDVTAGTATLVSGRSTYNLLFVSHWNVYNNDPDLVAVRFFGDPSGTRGGRPSEAPIAVFDRLTFENAMNAFVLGGP